MRMAALGAVGAAALLAAGVHALNRPPDALARIRRAGVVRIGYAPEPPFAFRTGAGRVTGESPELALAVFRALGVRRVEWVQAEFRALIPELRAGRFDVVAAGLYVTPERAREVAFSRPTFVAPAALLVPRTAVRHVRGLADVRRLPGARVAVLAGAFEERLARAAGIGPERIVRVPDASTGIEAVRAGRAAAFALSRLALRAAERSHATGDLAVVFPLRDTLPAGVEAVGRGALAFRQTDPELRRAVDAQLARLVGTAAHLRLVAPFGLTAADLPRATAGAP